MTAISKGESGDFLTTVPTWGRNGVLHIGPADRYDELFGSNLGQQQSLNLSGSSDVARYRVSFGTSETEGELKTAYDNNDYQRSRANEYPSMADQLDDIYHNGVDEWKKTIKAIKDKYPKPS